MQTSPTALWSCPTCGLSEQRSSFASRPSCRDCGTPMNRAPERFVCHVCGAEAMRVASPRPSCFDCGTPYSSSATNELSSMRDRVVRSTTVIPSPVTVRVHISGRKVYYCQNPAQSGDTTGVGVALALFPSISLIFFINTNEVDAARDFLQFYADLGVQAERLVLVVGDSIASSRDWIAPRVEEINLDQTQLDWFVEQGEQRYKEGLKEVESWKQLKNFRKDNYDDEVNSLSRAREDRRKRAFADARKILSERFAVQREGIKVTVDTKEGPQVVTLPGAEARRELKQKALHQAGKKFARIAGTIVAWDHIDERGGNQLYQDLLNLGLRTTVGTNLRGAYQRHFDVRNAQFCDVGQTTRDVAGHVKAKGLRATVHGVRKALSTRRYEDVESFVDTFVTKLVKAQPYRSKGLKPTLVLIWSRGLNLKELGRVKLSGISPTNVGDKLEKTLDIHKRNPQHVMTAQLYATLRHAVLLLNNKKKFSAVNTKRWIIPVPIGDELMLDWYDYERAPEKNLYEGASDLNLIKFFKRVSSFEGSRHAQMVFLHLLTQRIPTIQVGIRSGAMEQGMYLGVPTIYLEEADSPSGGRMASLATDLTSFLTFFPMTYATAERYPFFFRLKTKHHVGLNQARSLKAVEEVVAALDDERRTVDSRVLRGTLTVTEFEALLHGLAGICKELDTYELALK